MATYVDVVDNDDNVIGYYSREDVYNKKMTKLNYKDPIEIRKMLIDKNLFVLDYYIVFDNLMKM